ncbi:MAG: hypothetical protein SFV18_16105 [Bryobacteraceae bacterium]|nr:hypothetical protein [Bryobacteraceae bacterium]
MVRLLMVLDQLKHPALFGTPLARFAVKERYLNPAIQLVFVKRFKAVLKTLMVSLQSRYRFIVVPSFVGMALFERRGNPIDDLLVQ